MRTPDPLRVEELANCLAQLKEKLQKTELVAVTKYSDLTDIEAAYLAGQRDFGENRVDDLKAKASVLSAKYDDINWHFIGNLQTNKINHLLGVVGLTAIHSVDSLKLLEALNQRMDRFQGQELLFYLQINTSGEEEKHGFHNLPEIKEAMEVIGQGLHAQLKLEGLMTMGRIRTEAFADDARASYAQLVEYKRQIKKEYAVDELKLSMGMTQDFEIAVEMGADVVRIGSLIFKSEFKT